MDTIYNSLDRAATVVTQTIAQGVQWVLYHFLIRPIQFILQLEWRLLVASIEQFHRIVLVPILDFFDPATQFVLRYKNRVIKAILITAFLTGFTVFMAVVLYAIFYIYFVPQVSLEQQVYFDFEVEEPEAIVYIRNTDFFYKGQEYDVTITLEMPDSPENVQAGMFMLETELFGDNGTVVRWAKRPVIMRYKSTLLRYMHTVFYSFPLLLGIWEEKQILNVPLIENLDSAFYEGIFRLSKPALQVYSAYLHVNVQLHGLRYLAYYWFFTSAVFGIVYIMIMELWFLLIVWLAFTRYQRRRVEEQKVQEKILTQYIGRKEDRIEVPLPEEDQSVPAVEKAEKVVTETIKVPEEQEEEQIVGALPPQTHEEEEEVKEEIKEEEEEEEESPDVSEDFEKIVELSEDSEKAPVQKTQITQLRKRTTTTSTTSSTKP